MKKNWLVFVLTISFSAIYHFSSANQPRVGMNNTEITRHEPFALKNNLSPADTNHLLSSGPTGTYYYYLKMYCDGSTYQETERKVVVTSDYIYMYISGNKGYWVEWGNQCRIEEYSRATIDGIPGDAFVCTNGTLYFFYYYNGKNMLLVKSQSGNCEVFSD